MTDATCHQGPTGLFRSSLTGSLRMGIARGLLAALSVAFLAWGAAAQQWKSDNGVRVVAEPDGANALAVRYWPAPTRRIESIAASIGQTPLPVEPAKPFPGDGQKAAVLILVDTSDPRRRQVVRRNIKQIADLAVAAPAHVVFGLATFDRRYTELVPLGGDASAVATAARKLRATGRTTELYRHTRSALNKLAGFDAARKTLIILSDGRAEDTAYTLDDVIATAKTNAITVNGIGFSRTIEGTRSFQTLIRLAEETGGRFVAANQQLELPGDTDALIYSALNAGGSTRIDLTPAINAGLGGPQDVRIVFEGANATVVWPVTLPPAPINKTIFKPDNMPWISGLGIGLVVLFLLLVVWLRRRYVDRKTATAAEAEEAARLAALEHPIAHLKFFDEGEPEYPMRSSAIRIGRRADNDIQISNTSISAYHAEIQQRRDGTFIITDLDSLNGVSINDEPVDVGQLKDGDVVDLGETRFRFELAADIETAKTVKGARGFPDANPTRPDWQIARKEG